MSEVPHTPINTTIRVKSHARLLLLRIALLCWAVILVFLLAGELFLVWAFSSHQADSMTWAILAFAAIYLDGLSGFFLVRTIRRYRAWKRFEQQRQEAANGRSTLLAAEQPESHLPALSLPVTIAYHPPVLRSLFSRMITQIIIIIICVFIFFSTANAGVIGNTLFIVVIGLLMVFVWLSDFWRTYARDRKNILVTEDGIRVSGPFARARFLAWQDMRLLAIADRLPTRSLRRLARYQMEIAGEKQIVSWPWTQPVPSPIPYFNDPADTLQGYERNIHNLLALTFTKTGLRLYDLRKQ